MAAPTSTNEVTARKLSASISALWAKIKSTFQTLGNLVTAWGSTPSDTKYPSEKLVKTDLDNRLDRFDAVYNRNNTAGGGWVKLADTKPYTSIKQVDKPAIWDVMITRCTGETSSEQLCLNVRYDLSGLPSIYFKRFYTINRTTTHKFAVVVSGVGGGTVSEGKVELWAFLEKHWGSIAIREVAGSQSTNLYGMNKIQYNYYSYTMEGGADKPTEDLENHIQVVDSTDVKLTAEDKANKSEGVYYVVGSSEYTAYSASSTYTATTSSGPFTSANSCTYGGIAYFCKTTISTPEAWTSAHWTAMATPVLTGNIDGLTALYAGLKIAYKMSIRGGTSSTYLNINNLGNKYIIRNAGNLTTHLPANTVVFLAYDGTYWRWADYDYAPNNWVTTMGAYCDTAAATQAKTAISTNTVYTAGEAFLIRIVNANTYNGKITLNINSQGAKDVWINGAVSSSSNKTLPAGEHWCYYDGTVFHIWTDGTAQFTKLKATSYKGLEYTNGENLVYQYVSGGSSNCTYPADHSYVTIAPDNRDTYFGIKFAEDVAADEIISAAFDVEYTGDDDGQFKWEFKAIGQQGGIKITITGAGHYTAYGVAGLAVSKGTLQNAAFDDLGRTLPANSLKIKNFKFERGATATGFCLCKDETSIGHAETADKINTSVKIGDTNQPVYVAADGTVTPISYTIATSVPANAVFTDTKVKATAKTDNVNYKILATASASPTSGNATEAVYDTDITLNPSTNTIAASISGNAATATTAQNYNTSTGTIKTALDGKVDFGLSNNTSNIGNGAPAADCISYWGSDNIPNNHIKMVYNVPGNEATLIFSKRSTYGSIVKYGYADKYVYILRNQNGTWKSNDWEKISAGYADSAGTATTAQNYDTNTGTIKTALAGKSDTSHTHGNITNAGGITASGVTIANGDSLVIVDSSETNKLVAKTSVTFDGSTTTKALSQKGTFETFLTSHQSIAGKMNTSADNATAPSSSGGDGATATLLNNLTEGNSDIVTTDDGDNVLIATTDNRGTVTDKWYKRKLVKLIPWIIKKLSTRLVYDCGAGSTSGDDFDAALAAFNAGQWVIIHSSRGVYYCVGTYSGGLRFKKLSNEASLLKVDTITWNRGSAPTAGNQIEASLSGHTHTRSDITNFAHTHGNITNAGGITASGVTIANGDSLVIVDSSETNKLVAKTSVTFDGSTTTKALTQKGTFETFMTPSAGNASSGALQNLTAQLSEGTSDFTDNTEIFTSYAGNNGFAESGHVNQPYRRKASSMLNYVRDGFAIERSPANVGTAHKRISLGYGEYSSSNYVGAMTYIVRLFFNYADDGGLQGKGITVLVTYDFRRSDTQKSECRILSDNGVRDAGYNVVLANYVSGSGDNGKLYICIGLVKNSAPTTLVEFNYSYCKIFRVSTVGDWVEDISSDAVGTYNYIVQATDLVSAAVNADMVDGKHIVIGSWAGASNTIYFG